MLATIFLHTLTSFISGTEKDSHMIVSLIESLEFSEFFHDQLYQLATIFHIANRAWKKKHQIWNVWHLSDSDHDTMRLYHVHVSNKF